MKKNIFVCNKIFIVVVLMYYTTLVNAQNSERIINQTNSCRLLHVRPNMVIGIAPTGGLLVQTNIDAQYWYKEKMNFRLSALGGTFTGISVGGTLHTKDEFVKRSQKFIVSETESNGKRITEYYKRNAEIRKVVGPTADLKFAFIDMEKNGTANPFIELRGGLDFQTFSRNFLEKNNETYPSNRNGWFSVKALGAIQYLKSQTKSAVQFGALGSLCAVKSPWKTVSFNLNLDLGVTFGGAGVLPIISPGFGLSINLIKSKKPIDY